MTERNDTEAVRGIVDSEIIRYLKAQLDRANALCRIRLDRIRELESQLEAIGAGGVGPLMAPATTEQSSAVPEGWKLVPVEPTPEMMLHASGCKHHEWNDMNCSARKTRRSVWATMLYAAPQSPKSTTSMSSTSEAVTDCHQSETDRHRLTFNRLTREQWEAIAHRTASRYSHRSDPHYIAYTFLPHTLEDFVNKLQDAIEGRT